MKPEGSLPQDISTPYHPILGKCLLISVKFKIVNMSNSLRRSLVAIVTSHYNTHKQSDWTSNTQPTDEGTSSCNTMVLDMFNKVQSEQNFNNITEEQCSLLTGDLSFRAIYIRPKQLQFSAS